MSIDFGRFRWHVSEVRFSPFQSLDQYSLVLRLLKFGLGRQRGGKGGNTYAGPNVGLQFPVPCLGFARQGVYQEGVVGRSKESPEV